MIIIPTLNSTVEGHVWLTDGLMAKNVLHSKLHDLTVKVVNGLQTPQPS